MTDNGSSGSVRRGTGRPPRRDEFDAMYAGTAPWDIGRPQPALRALDETGRLRGRVLDVGCGTGEHALMAAAAGMPATGVDISPRAIGIAARKARERNLVARFVVGDVLDLADLGERYDTALDCGLFHVLGDSDRARFVDSLRAVVVPGGCYHMLCFSDREPGDYGPRRIGRQEISATFATGWRVDAIEPATIELISPPPALCWLATITRL
jgi:SAM-dependent methyltransferase